MSTSASRPCTRPSGALKPRMLAVRMPKSAAPRRQSMTVMRSLAGTGPDRLWRQRLRPMRMLVYDVGAEDRRTVAKRLVSLERHGSASAAIRRPPPREREVGCRRSPRCQPLARSALQERQIRGRSRLRPGEDARSSRSGRRPGNGRDRGRELRRQQIEQPRVILGKGAARSSRRPRAPRRACHRAPAARRAPTAAAAPASAALEPEVERRLRIDRRAAMSRDPSDDAVAGRRLEPRE